MEIDGLCGNKVGQGEIFFQELFLICIRSKSLVPVGSVQQLGCAKTEYLVYIKFVRTKTESFLRFQRINGIQGFLLAVVDSNFEAMDIIGLSGEKEMDHFVINFHNTVLAT
jgi:hypothetical protein